jgi:hypothetical protein
MAVTLELDIDKNQNESAVRALFNELSYSQYSQNFTFRFEQKKCFKQLITINVCHFMR